MEKPGVACPAERTQKREEIVKAFETISQRRRDVGKARTLMRRRDRDRAMDQAASLARGKNVRVVEQGMANDEPATTVSHQRHSLGIPVTKCPFDRPMESLDSLFHGSDRMVEALLVAVGNRWNPFLAQARQEPRSLEYPWQTSEPSATRVITVEQGQASAWLGNGDAYWVSSR